MVPWRNDVRPKEAMIVVKEKKKKAREDEESKGRKAALWAAARGTGLTRLTRDFIACYNSLWEAMKVFSSETFI